MKTEARLIGAGIVLIVLGVLTAVLVTEATATSNLPGDVTTQPEPMTTKTTPSGSGLQGFVYRGPIAPVCVAGTPCSEPARNVTLAFSRRGRVVGRVVTNSAGQYRIHLLAGRYRVRYGARPSSQKAIAQELAPNHARVSAGRFTRVNFSIDTGIR
jgi:hypothetical protein